MASSTPTTPDAAPAGTAAATGTSASIDRAAIEAKVDLPILYVDEHVRFKCMNGCGLGWPELYASTLDRQTPLTRPPRLPTGRTPDRGGQQALRAQHHPRQRAGERGGRGAATIRSRGRGRCD